MVTLLLRCRVADFDAWKRGYDEAVARDRELGVGLGSARVWRGRDDPSLVVVAEVYESREAAEAVLADPAVREEMAEHGIDLDSIEHDYLDEVDGPA